MCCSKSGANRWRVTLKSIHPGELRVIPRRKVKKLNDIISYSVNTGVFESFELTKSSVEKLKEMFSDLDYFSSEI
jgi:hypothetical protein